MARGTRHDQDIERLGNAEAVRKVLREVARDGDSFIVESHGEPVAAVVPVRILESWERERQQFFDDMWATAERVNLSEEEAERLVAEVIERVRAQERARPTR